MKMVTYSAQQLVNLIEKLIIQQQAHLWEFSDSDNDLGQQIMKLRLNILVKGDIDKISDREHGNAPRNLTCGIDGSEGNILDSIERTFNNCNVKLFELLENKIDLKNQIEELKEYHRHIEIKCESVNNFDSNVIDNETDEECNRTDFMVFDSNFIDKNSKNKQSSQLQQQLHSLGNQRAGIKLKRKINSTRYTCDICSKSYARKTTIKYHMRKHQTFINKEDQGFKCVECNKILTTKNGLREHMIIHNGTKSVECDECKRRFYTTSKLKSHKKQVHLKLYDKSEYKCTKCDRTFPTSYFLRAHMFKHTNETYECNECKKVYSTPVLLKKHMNNMHSGVKTMQCEICDKIIATSAYKNHKYYAHTSVKLYKCEFCERAFKTRSHLTKHQYIHTGERPKQCDVCGKGFTTQHQLNVHQRIHTGEKPYACQICQQKFSNTVYLKSHMKNVHKTLKK